MRKNFIIANEEIPEACIHFSCISGLMMSSRLSMRSWYSSSLRTPACIVEWEAIARVSDPVRPDTDILVGYPIEGKKLIFIQSGTLVGSEFEHGFFSRGLDPDYKYLYFLLIFKSFKNGVTKCVLNSFLKKKKVKINLKTIF